MFVVTGNRLLDGIVVYLSASDGWVENLQNASCFDSQDDGQAALAKQDADIVSLEIIPVEQDGDGDIRAARLRENIRANGPTINPFETIDLARRFAPAD